MHRLMIRSMSRQVGMLGVSMVVEDVDCCIGDPFVVKTCDALGSSIIIRNSDALSSEVALMDITH